MRRARWRCLEHIQKLKTEIEVDDHDCSLLSCDLSIARLLMDIQNPEGIFNRIMLRLSLLSFTGCSISTLQHSSGYFLLFRLILRNIHTTLEYWKLFLVLTKKTFFIPLVMAYFMWYPAINEVASKTQPLQSVCACLGTRTQLCSLLWSCFTFWHQLTKFLHQSKWRILCRITQ